MGAFFYHYISENFTAYMEGGDASVDSTPMSDTDIPEDVKVDAIKTKGYFISPSQLFGNVIKKAPTNKNLVDTYRGVGG